MTDLNKRYPFVAIALVLGVLMFPSATLRAADFQVAATRSSVTQCSMTGSILTIDPVSGNVSINLSADFACYPQVINSIANNASLSVTGSTTVGGGATGAGVINLQLNTGLSGPTTGVTCVPDGFSSSNVSISNDWTTNLCTGTCGATVTRTVNVQNTSPTLDGSVTFKAKCSYQDQANVNLSSVRANIQSAPSVTVLHGTTPPPTYCQSVTQLSNPKGLTDGMRQLAGTVTGGTIPGTGIPFLNYVSVFGVIANTYPPGSGDTAGFGFPGTNTGTLTTFITAGQYVSLQFRAPTNSIWPGRAGADSFVVNPQNQAFSAAIAPCPGQFDTDPLFPMNAACKGESVFTDINWLITNSTTTTACKLEPGKTYYFNMIHAPVGTPSQTSCTSTSCKVQFRSAHSY